MTLRPTGTILAVLAVQLCACSDPTPTPTGSIPPGATPVQAAIALGATPLAVDARGVPHLLHTSKLAPVRGMDTIDTARMHVERLAPAWGVTTLPELRAQGEVPVLGGKIARLRQVIDGMPVWSRDLKLLVRPDGGMVAASGVLIGVETPHGAAKLSTDDAGAIVKAIDRQHGVKVDPRTLSTQRMRGDGSRILTGTSALVDVQLASARKFWYPIDGALVASWVVEAYTSRKGSTDGDAFRTVISGDGRILAHHSLKADAAFNYRVFAETTGELHPFDGPLVDGSPHPAGTPNGSYPAFTTPALVSVEGLNHPGGSATPDPWLPATRTETFGNNVEAYADFNAPSGLTFGDFRATATAARTFDRPYNTTQGPLETQAQQMASITSLFYNINWLHDFWYDAGFTEAAGNGQENNYMRGGEDRDAILAEAQDNALGGSRNNANMSTPADGLPPRMQVFLWTGKDDRTMSLAPSGRTPGTNSAAFGPKSFDVSALLTLADDFTAPNINDACQPLAAGACTGKIVLADRGNCTFKTKALNIQNAGGVGMILANNTTSTSPPTMGEDATITTPITIGSLSVTMAEGAALKTDLIAGPVTATLHRLAGPELDGALDSTLIAHEFGHYLHHRLQDCTNTMCRAISEGWGDFLALMMLARSGDNLMGAYPFSVYTTVSFSSDPAYYGIRRAPYSANPAINSLSFRHMAAGEPLPTTHPFLPFGPNEEVHNAGEIWAAALWDAYVGLQQAGSSFDEVHAKMAKYIVGGLLMAPVDATPTETRDAILAVAFAASPADHDILAAGFARRGFGSCAVSPPRDSATFEGMVEGNEVRGQALVGAATLAPATSCDEDMVLDAGETARITMPVTNPGHTAITDAVATVTTSTFGLAVTSAPVAIGNLAAYSTSMITIDVSLEAGIATEVAGELEVAITGTGACNMPPTKIALRLNVDDVTANAKIDTFDAGTSVWTTAGDAMTWTHVRATPLDGEWHGAGPGTTADVSLITPALEIGSDPVSMTFQHHYDFELANNIAFDGGVIELSTDAGVTWNDISTLVAPGYGLMIDATSGNPLAGRPAFTGTNASTPDKDVLQLDFGTQLANKTVQFRFRIGTDAGVGSYGWDIDDVQFSGITGTPFPAQVIDAAMCDDENPPDPPLPPPGEAGCCDAGPLRAGNALFALGLLAFVLRRRRRS